MWAITDSKGIIFYAGTTSDELFIEAGLKSADSTGKLSISQAVWKLEHRFNHSRIDKPFLVSFTEDNRTMHKFIYGGEKGKSQAGYNIESHALSRLVFDGHKDFFQQMIDNQNAPSNNGRNLAQSNCGNAQTQPTQQPQFNTMNTSNQTSQDASAVLAQAIQTIAGNAINEDKVVAIVEDAIRKATLPTITQLNIKLPSGQTTKVEGQHEMFPELLKTLGGGMSAMLKGDAGSGKTYGAKVAAKTLGLDFRIFSFTSETSLGRTFGFIDANGNYVATAVREMYENGGLLILDEFDAANENVAMALNNLLDGEEYVFADKVVSRHSDFRYVACTNTYGKGADKRFNSRRKLDDATLDRFDVILNWNYDEQFETRLFGNTEATKVCQSIRKNANAMGMNGLITPRRTRAVNKLVELGYSIKDAVHMSITNSHKDDVVKGLLDGVRL